VPFFSPSPPPSEGKYDRISLFYLCWLQIFFLLQSRPFPPSFNVYHPQRDPNDPSPFADRILGGLSFFELKLKPPPLHQQNRRAFNTFSPFSLIKSSDIRLLPSLFLLLYREVSNRSPPFSAFSDSPFPFIERMFPSAQALLHQTCLHLLLFFSSTYP